MGTSALHDPVCVNAGPDNQSGIMNMKRISQSLAVSAGLFAAATAPAWAIDTVHRKSTDKAPAGEIASVSRTEVVVKPKVGSETTVPANDIRDVDWEGAPPAIKLGRSQENAGQLELALNQYQQASQEVASGKPNLRAELEFLLARAFSRVALGDSARHAEAIGKLKAFTEKQREHYRFYDAQLLLGELALVANEFATADTAFQSIADSPWPDYQAAGKIGGARLLLERNDVGGAKVAFDAVAAMNASTPGETTRKLQAMLGQATCLQKQSQYAESVKILDQVVRDSSASDTRLQAEAYVRQGDCFVALGDKPKQAIMAYLHVDVVPSLAQEKDFHAEALYHLAQLWGAVGQPARAAEAAARLEQQYPNSEWAKKPASGG